METAHRPGCSLPLHLSGQPVAVDRLPSEVIASHRRERVLTAATEVFATRGYRATTVDDLAAAAHVGVGTFYALFDGKQDCFLQACDLILADGCERIEAAIDPAASWPEQARAALEALLGWIAAEPQRACLILIGAQTAGRGGEARYEATLDAAAAALRQGRCLGPHDAQLPESFECVATTGVAWVLYERLLDERAEQVEALLPDLLEIVVEPYAATADEPPPDVDSLPVSAPLPALAAERSS